MPVGGATLLGGLMAVLTPSVNVRAGFRAGRGGGGSDRTRARAGPTAKHRSLRQNHLWNADCYLLNEGCHHGCSTSREPKGRCLQLRTQKFTDPNKALHTEATRRGDKNPFWDVPLIQCAAIYQHARPHIYI
ncbi:uncharacterized protein EI90DRAFT_1102639 [Cantharellus anzutake]|uniref:uncharacterized protein n=1 Tax=Cantharellus anzutake TaxID=1750568 RepID=UPI0019056B22|nr:uncharacterized protein EI90DRAFT_1102639 [Cantharellus anzutake]KAF8330846.1 hypothetical protein EI90DRAFT_1102639 [Cantharellus anzutake]